MRPTVALLAAALAPLAPGAAAAQTSRTVQLTGASGQPAGTATFTAAPKGTLIRIEATGLAPGWHGLHLHMVGDCSDAAAGFKRSGGHTHGGAASVHGLLNPAATDTGDLPDLHAAADGTAAADVFTPLVTLDQLADADGSALLIHAAPDDYRTQPIGGAGARVACGVVK